MQRRTFVAGATAIGAMSIVTGPLLAKETGNNLLAKVNAVAAAYAAAWNNADMTAMGALYTPDIHWVNIMGMHWQGFAEVDHAHRVYFDMMFKGVPLQLEEVESATAIQGGTVVAVLRWRVGEFEAPSGAVVPPSRNRMTLVLVPDRDNLRIAHGANIEINESAAKNDPVKRKPATPGEGPAIPF